MPQGVVIDDMLVAQTNDGLAFDIERFPLESLILRRGNFAPAFVGIFCAKFQLSQALIVFSPQPLHGVGRKFPFGRQLLDQFNCCLVCFDPRQIFPLLRLIRRP